MPDSIEDTKETPDGTIVYWHINATPTQVHGSMHADRYKLSLSIKASDSNEWGPEVEFFPKIEEVSTMDANGERQIDMDKVHAYLFKATDGESYARNWRLDLFGNR